jgi:hypothetical protein
MWLYVKEKYADGTQKIWFINPVCVYYDENELYCAAGDGSYCLFKWENVIDIAVFSDDVIAAFGAAQLGKAKAAIDITKKKEVKP